MADWINQKKQEKVSYVLITARKKKYHIQYGLDSSAQLQARSHLGHHQVGEELIYKPFRQGKLRFREIANHILELH